MSSFSVKSVALCALFLVIGSVSIVSAQEVNVSRKGVVLDGYDVVSYHTENEAVKGVRGNSAEWNDVTWVFCFRQEFEAVSC